jgi:predicted methyltransferase
MQHKLFILLFAFMLTACGEPSESESGSDNGSASLKAVYEAAVANPQRTDADRGRDAGRRPAAVLEFFGIEPGMQVLDMFSGGGYYSELLSYVVGPDGEVVSHTNSAYARFVGEETTIRYADNRLANVKILLAENNELDVPAEEFDAVMMVLAYHDIYYADPENGWPKIDGPGLIAELYSSLKPGGIVAVVDHYAAAGSPRETGGSLHRIDPEIVIDEMQSAGFVLDGKSDVLRNMDDDHSLNMSDPKVRGKTDRFVFRFRKP